MEVPAKTYRMPGPRLGGCLSAALGMSVLAGWMWNVGAVLSVIPGQITMKANSAIGFLCAGLALLVVTRAHRTQRSQMMAAGLAIMVIAVGLSTLIEYFLHCNLRHQEEHSPTPTNRSGSGTADPNENKPGCQLEV